MKFDEILKENKYYTLSDLRYNQELGYNLNNLEIKEFLDYKDSLVDNNENGFKKLNLNSFNSKHIFLNLNIDLTMKYDEYISLITNDDVFSDNYEERKRARIYSEVEGSLNIEGINSTRLIFDKLLEGKRPENDNEIVIRNMARAIEFSSEGHEFNKENLKKLYDILSQDALNDEQKLRDNDSYRYDMVYISEYNGSPVNEIEKSMDSLFLFVNNNLKIENPLLRFLIPHIIHYYILYIHPYFDLNGRTARICSLLVSKLLGFKYAPYFISEAINDTKSEYYKAISRTRDSRNDLTYFLIYILDTSIFYAKSYGRINGIKKELKSIGEELTIKEETYLKKIILKSKGSFFTWKDFVKFI